MHIRTRTSVGAAVIAIGVFVLALAGPAGAASPVRYVALGDSYSSGVGAGDYVSSSGSCDRSVNAYSAIWTRAHSPASYSFMACSGAKTSDVAASQLSAVTRATTLVSLTIGGNDENFATIMQDCNLHGTNTCVSEVHAAQADAVANLPGKLDSLFGAIASRAPAARVVVLGYPRFYDLAHDCVGLSRDSRTAIDGGIDTLDRLLREAAGRRQFTFADARPAFAGHVICDDNRWLHSVNFGDLGESYHPTGTGQSQGYYPAFNAVA